MSVKRRDNKNRILRNGESQRKDGRYTYSYFDADGKQKFIYSWKLENSDKLPIGKRECESLRSQIKKLKKDIDDEIVPYGGGITVLQLVKKYVSRKRGVRYNTRYIYDYAIKVISEDIFGKKRIDKLKVSDAKEWFVKLQDEGKSYGTIGCIKGVLRPAFQMAVDDDLIRKNPFEFVTNSIIINDRKKVEPITEEQQEQFLDFIKNDKYFSRYYDAIYILFHTGLRISEFCGLRDSDIDFKRSTIKIDHQLLTRYVDGNLEYYIEYTKTSSGIRYVPMTKNVIECFKRVQENRETQNVRFLSNDMQGLIFLRKNGVPMAARHWDSYFKGICDKYNKNNNVEMPKITPHVCRHTFCSNLARRRMNIKTLQYIMGHSTISITLDIYAHVNHDDAVIEMDRLYAGL